MKHVLKNIWRWMAARPSFRRINQFLLTGSLHGLGILNWENDILSGERHFVGRILPKYTGGRTPTMVDVGANEGSYLKLLREYHPEAMLIAFEANPRTFQKLGEAFSDTRVKLVNKGLGSKESTLKFYDVEDSEGSSPHGSLYREVIEEIHHKKAVEMEVELVTLDQYAIDNEIDRICLLKIDTEGHELEVIRGAQNLLANARIDVLQLEFNEMNLISRVFYRDIRKALTDYIPYRLLPHGAIQLNAYPLHTELFAYQNLVFVHKEFQPNRSMWPTVRAGGN